MTMPRACVRCQRDTVRIQARGLCGRCYSRHRDEYPVTKHHRAFTGRERAFICRDWGKLPSAQIAAGLGRPVSDVYAAAVRFGATRPRHVLKTDAALRARLVRLHGDGLSDREIAAQVEFGHGTVARWLRRLGLPSNCRTKPTDPFPQRTKDKQRAVALRRIREDGLESAVPFMRKHVEGRALAVRMGWPQAETLLEARVLEHLRLHGPATVDALASAIGLRRNWLGNRVRAMRARGLLARAGRDGRDMIYALASDTRQIWPKRDSRAKPEPSPVRAEAVR